MRLLRRLRCHGSIVCCHYVDQPTCNSPMDKHILGQLAWARRARHAA